MTVPGFSDVIAAWDEAARRPDISQAIHPAGGDPVAYEESGERTATHLLALFGDLPSGPIIDFGAGDGRVAVPLARLCDRPVITVDSSREMLNRLAVRAGDLDIATRCSNGTKTLPKAAGIYALAVLIHHNFDDASVIFATLATALKRGGRMVLDVPLYEEPRTRADWTDISVWTLPQMEALAGANGLTIVSTGVSNGAFEWSRPLGHHHGTPTVLLKP